MQIYFRFRFKLRLGLWIKPNLTCVSLILAIKEIVVSRAECLNQKCLRKSTVQEINWTRKIIKQLRRVGIVRDEVSTLLVCG